MIYAILKLVLNLFNKSNKERMIDVEIYYTIIGNRKAYLEERSKKDYEKVYEYDFTKLRNINNEFEFIKLNKIALEGYDTYADNNDEVFDWIVYLKSDNEAIANIMADRVQKDIKAIELSFNMHPNHWKKGYMTEAVICVMDYLFNNGFENIIYSYDEGNIKSKCLNEKLGFELFKIKENAW